MKQTVDVSGYVQIVSIHDMDPKGFLSFDLFQIMETIQDLVREYAWLVTDIACTGGPVPTRTILSFGQLLEYFQHVEQTIDGTVIGCPSADLAVSGIDLVARIAAFPWTPARVAILAIDSSYFEVIAKDTLVIKRIRERFRDVREQDPNSYFAQ